jgi:hypothetical protein
MVTGTFQWIPVKKPMVMEDQSRLLLISRELGLETWKEEGVEWPSKEHDRSYEGTLHSNQMQIVIRSILQCAV